MHGLPGESFLDVLDGLHDSPISAVVTRHEGGAGFRHWWREGLTGLPGVAMVAIVTRGSGAANAFSAVHTAYQDATPMVLFVGLIPMSDRGREAFQEFDPSGWFGRTAKKVVTLDDPAAAVRVVSESPRIGEGSWISRTSISNPARIPRSIASEGPRPASHAPYVPSGSLAVVAISSSRPSLPPGVPPIHPDSQSGPSSRVDLARLSASG